MAKRGAKNKYKTLVEPYLKQINEKVRKGVTEESIAKALGISVASLNNYRNKYPEFKEALSKDKGADVLQDLINAGIEAAKGYYKENETTIIIIDPDEKGENGEKKAKKAQKTITKTWYPPNPALNQFYVKNYGRAEGFTHDPLEYDLKKERQELDKAAEEAKNWFK